MANNNDPRNQGQRPPQPAITPTPTAAQRPPVTPALDADEDERDEVTTPAPAHEETSLLAAVRRKLGLGDDASPMDLLRAVAGMKVTGYSGPARAACKLRLSHEGRRVVLNPGDLIPEGVDMSKLPAHAVEGR